LPVLTSNQIKEFDNDCVRMYLYCYYNYPEFYSYKKKKLSRCIDNIKVNLLLFSSMHGNLNAVKYLVTSGLNINHTNTLGQNAYIYAVCNDKFEMLKYLETTNINIYQPVINLEDMFDGVDINSEIYIYFINKSKYSGYSKICSICYECQDKPFITCKNNHTVHLDCQRIKDKSRCILCSSKYLI
jgi:hypothetical protein